MIAFILFILAVEKQGYVYAMLSTMLWTILFVQTIILEDMAGNYYYERGLAIFCLAFVFTSVVVMLINRNIWKIGGRLP